MKHIGGNLNSRWRDFRTTDGEKPDRHRDAEFEPGESRDAVVATWARGWGMLDGALGALTPADLAGHVVIRGERIALPRALARNLSHVAGHVHQLVLLAKHWTGPSWKTLEHPAGDVRAGPARGYIRRVGSARLKVHPTRTDEEVNMRLQSLALLVLAGIALTLYIMRRRSRQGKRTPKF